jgi:hypothetical protein
MKTFKQIREAVKTEENPEAKELKPRAKGEQAFADAHTRQDNPYPTKNTDAVLNARGMKQTTVKKEPANGDQSVVQQGTSKLADQSGFKGQQSKTKANVRADNGDTSVVKTSPTAVDKDSDESTTAKSSDGEKGIVRTSPSAVKPFKEDKDIIDCLVDIVEENSEDVYELTFANGDTINIDKDIALVALEAYCDLDEELAKEYRDHINESSETFDNLFKLVLEAREVE